MGFGDELLEYAPGIGGLITNPLQLPLTVAKKAIGAFGGEEVPPGAGSNVPLTYGQTPSEKIAAELQQQRDASIQDLLSRPDTIRRKSGSYQSPAISKAQAAAGIRAVGNEATDRTNALKVAEARRLEFDRLNQDVTSQAIKNVRAISESLGKRSPALRRRAEEAEKAFDELSAEVKGSKLDPDRLIETMPSWGQTLLFVSTAFDQLQRSLRPSQVSGPSVFAIINGAINRDLQVQRANMDARLRQLGVADRERQFALGRLDKIQSEQRAAANKVTELKLAQIAAQSGSVDRQLKAANAMIDYRASAASQTLDLQKAARGKSISGFVDQPNTTKQAGLAAMVGEKLQLKPKEMEAVFEGKKSAKAFGALADRLVKMRKRGNIKNFFSSNVPFFQTEAKQLVGAMQSAAIQLAKAKGAGVVSDSDQKFISQTLPSLIGASEAQKIAILTTLEEMAAPIRINAQEAVNDGRRGAAIRQYQAAAVLEKELRRFTGLLQ